MASLSAWRRLTGGTVLPVRRTEAAYVNGASSVAVPALGVPAEALARLHGWRASDGSASLHVLARRLRPPGPARVPGPAIPASARGLSVRAAAAPGLAVDVTAVLRERDGLVHPVVLGTTGRRPALLRAQLPSRRRDGPWELEALALTEPAGLEATNGHQNGENAAAATRFATQLRLRDLRISDRTGRAIATVPLAQWRSVGAAGFPHGARDGLEVSFATTGSAGLLRPAQPSDDRPTPVLADPQTAAAASPGGLIPLTVDGLSVPARVVGVVRRFPTVPAGSAGFVIADEPTLAGALDAADPGQGEPDELWIATRHTGRLRALVARPLYAQLSLSVRAQIERGLRAEPISRAIVGTLLAAAGLCALLAVVGLLVAMLGAARDERIEFDLVALGVGPSGIRRELRLRLALAALAGVCAGVLIGVLITRLAVVTVRASGSGTVPHPALVTVAPWGQLAVWAIVAGVALGAAGWAASRPAIGRAAR